MNALTMLILSKALQLFLVLDPIGNTGIIASLISGFSKTRQRVILIREIMVSLVILIGAFFLGAYFLAALDISQSAITATGGIIFLLFSISLLFPDSTMVNIKNLDEEPFIVPIAMPLVVGPSSMATVILFSNDKNLWVSLGAILLAWLATGFLIFLGPALLIKVGKTGMNVVERLVGMICAMIAVKMLLKSVKLFLASIN
jgi:multiple antibiotic resistance protein